MLLLNFSHPLTDTQLAQVEDLTGEKIAEVRYISAQFDNAQPFAEQIRALVDEISLTPKEWQTLPILVNPPAYNFVAVILIAELHGQMGYFPAMVRIRPVPNSTPTQYEIAEVINLQRIRETVRKKRSRQ